MSRWIGGQKKAVARPMMAVASSRKATQHIEAGELVDTQAHSSQHPTNAYLTCSDFLLLLLLLPYGTESRTMLCFATTVHGTLLTEKVGSRRSQRRHHRITCQAVYWHMCNYSRVSTRRWRVCVVGRAMTWLSPRSKELVECRKPMSTRQMRST
jgi:hypothetical protein